VCVRACVCVCVNLTSEQFNWFSHLWYGHYAIRGKESSIL